MIIQFERGDIGDLLKINIALPNNFVLQWVQPEQKPQKERWTET